MEGEGGMSRQLTIAREAGVSFSGFVFGQLVRFGYNLAVARLLGAEYLGVYALVIAVIQVAEVAAAAGLDTGLLRFVNLREARMKTATIASAFKTASFFSVAVLLLLLLFSGSIARAFHGDRLLHLALIVAAFAIPLNVATSLAGHAIQSYKQLLPKVIATQIITPAALLAAMVLSRYAAGKDAALLVPYIPVALLAFVWIWPKLRRISGVGVHDIATAGMDRDMLKFALPLMAVSLFSMMSHWLDIVMLGYFCDTRTVGLYQPAARTAGMIRSVLLAFAGIAAPMIAEFHGKRQVQEIQKVYDLVTRWILMLIIPPVLLMVIIPEQVLSIFGRQFAGSSTALILLSAAALMQAFFGLGSTVLAMTGLERLSFVNQAVALLVQVLLSMLLIPAFGMNGAAISSLMVIGLLSLARAAELHVFLRIRMFSRALWKPLTAGAISGLAMLIARTWIEQLVPVYGLLAGIAVSWGIYALLIRKFRLEQEELDVIFRFMPFLKKESKQETL